MRKLICLLFLAVSVQAFEQIQISTSAPAGFEQTFLSAMQAQFNVKVISNPLASNTYAITVYGLNPSYNAPEDPPSTLQQALALGATVYAYGFANGQSYNQFDNRNIVEGFGLLCPTPVNNLFTWDPQTCYAVTSEIDNAIFQESLSTPTVIPGGF